MTTMGIFGGDGAQEENPEAERRAASLQAAEDLARTRDEVARRARGEAVEGEPVDEAEAERVVEDYAEAVEDDLTAILEARGLDPDETPTELARAAIIDSVRRDPHAFPAAAAEIDAPCLDPESHPELPSAPALDLQQRRRALAERLGKISVNAGGDVFPHRVRVSGADGESREIDLRKDGANTQPLPLDQDLEVTEWGMGRPTSPLLDDILPAKPPPRLPHGERVRTGPIVRFR